MVDWISSCSIALSDKTILSLHDDIPATPRGGSTLSPYFPRTFLAVLSLIPCISNLQLLCLRCHKDKKNRDCDKKICYLG